ncbi:DUF1254-domain-containing protein [Penicillium argentinense]|uniref:DUF1254-domain-containing protein n=1 Tax=Penicillium argentinense TaxID=1131581 RepID=A0A9W9EIS7_9EURO|nr:DUF1254-domain-containing protein [Penicillium argentinense]KAJ5082480.1 DUF1254-domain-containing protein [Penicillium argentinense]
MKASSICVAFGVAASASSLRLSPRIDEATEFTLTFAVPTIETANGTNRFMHKRQLATSDFQDVVRPNVDTLYSMSILDLTHHDLLVDVPVVNDRYWVFPFYDAYANNYVNLGSVHNSTAGKYLVRYTTDSKPGVELCTELVKQKKISSGECHGAEGIVTAPTPYGILLPRYAVKGTNGDLEKIHAFQDKSNIRRIPKHSRSRHEGHRQAPLTIPLLNSSISSDPATKIMQLTARITPNNPPRNISDLNRVNRMLERAGINFHEGTYEPPTGQNLTRAYAASLANMAKAAKQPANLVSLGHEWVQTSSQAQGDYGENYLMRQFIAYRGYLALTASEALYPSYSSDKGGRTMHLGPKEAYLFRFPSKPELAEFGFWSLTAYNAKQFLVENPLNRYALSDRSNLTYPDGERVYGGQQGEQKDGSFEILLQPADVEPPKNWTSNWLPAPRGGGDFSLTLRFYAPSEGLRGGEWAYPVVQKTAAMVG